jgi:hypothetical protein
MIIEQHKEALMQIMILCKMGPSAPEVHLTIAVIVNLNLIWRSSTRFFPKDGLAELSSIHECGKLQRHMLLLMASVI